MNEITRPRLTEFLIALLVTTCLKWSKRIPEEGFREMTGASKCGIKGKRVN